MAESNENLFAITKPGILFCGESLPSECSIVALCHNEVVVQLHSGECHSAVVCESGRVYTFGWDYNFKRQTEPTLVNTLEFIKVTEVVCGYDFIFFLSDKDQVFACGNNSHGQLGLGDDFDPSAVHLIRNLPPVKKVAAGAGHAALLTVGGEVWVCGRNDFGQLGLRHRADISTFTMVTGLSESITDISCGGSVTILLTASQRLLVTGKNDSYQLGLPDIESTATFLLMSVPTVAIVTIASGYNHSVALAVDGTVWTWGDNTMGQTGIGNCKEKSLPEKMAGIDGQVVSRVFAGCNNTALATKVDDMLVCGAGRSGQLGPSRQDVYAPTLLQKSPGLIIHQIAFADNYSQLLVSRKTRSASLTQTEPETSTRGCVTEYEKSLLASLECPVCFKVMCSPIHLCVSGHSICGSCYSHVDTTLCPLCRDRFSPGRNVTLERLCAELRLPCQDCMERMPAGLLDEHSGICPERRYPCPLQQTCSWTGRPETLLTHAAGSHTDHTWQHLPHSFLHSMATEFTRIDLLAAHGEMFTLHRNYSETTQKALFTVRYIGLPENATKYRFELEFNFDNDDCNIIIRKKVCLDVQTLDELFQIHNCISLKKDMVEIYLQQNNLSCRISVLKVVA